MMRGLFRESLHYVTALHVRRDTGMRFFCLHDSIICATWNVHILFAACCEDLLAVHRRSNGMRVFMCCVFLCVLECILCVCGR